MRRPPPFIQNHAMNFEILGTRPEIEPFPVVENNATDFAALRNPISQNRNEGDFLPWRNARENRRAPDRDVRKIVIARNPVAIRNVDDAIFTKGNGRSQASLPKREGDVVSAGKMFVDERL